MRSLINTFVCLALVLSGCATARNTAGVGPQPLTPEEQELASALAHFAQGLIYQAEEGRLSPDALGHFVKSAELRPGVRRVHSRMASVFLNQNLPDRAIQELEISAARNPGSVSGWIELAMTCQIASQLDKAAGYYGKAIELAPGKTFLYVVLARLRLQQGNDKDAIRVLRQGFSRAELPQLIVAYCASQALDFLRADQPERAIPFFSLAESYAGDNPRDLFSDGFFLFYGSAYERSGDIRNAERIFRQGIDLYPEAHDSMNYLAYMWAENDMKLDEALLLAVRAVELQPDNGAYLDTLGWVHYKKGNYDKALTYIGKAARLMPGDPVIIDHLGDVHAVLGDKKSAAVFWAKSLMIDPHNEDVAAKLLDAGFDLPSLPVDGANENQSSPDASE